MTKKKATAVFSALTLLAFQLNPVSAMASDILNGDFNSDCVINIADFCLLKSNIFESGGTGNLYDINRDGVINSSDCIMFQKFLFGELNEFPSGSTDSPSQNADPTDYMEKIRASIVTPEPSEISIKKADTEYGTVKQITYMSGTANREKPANVILPPGYNENEKYPVMYVNHGIFGNQNSMLDESMGIMTISANLAASGEAEKMIIVLGEMFSSSTMTVPGGFDIPTVTGYDAYLDDLTNYLMPYIEQNFSVKTGRENTAITGFSMGGREALYIGISRPDLFGYIGGACPAPGITPTQDANMVHPGSMQESEFRIKDSDPKPYVLMITGARFDGVVGDHPQKYHELLTRNGTNHIWQEVPLGGHDGVTVRAHFYNFAKAAFRA